MKQIIFFIVALLTALLIACTEPNSKDVLRFSTAADYPPFEYNDHGVLKGFDIDLARLIAKELGKKAVFNNTSFNTVLASLNSGQADAAIATITITEERQKQFDFSITYYFETMAALYPKQHPIKQVTQLKGKKVAVQLGSVIALWLQDHYPHVECITFDNNNQAVEALKAGHVDAVLVDGVQGAEFSHSNPKLGYTLIGKTNEGYSLALKKGSPLTPQINEALKTLRAKGTMQQLESTWIKPQPATKD